MVRFVYYKQKTSYEMPISDWSSDVCSSDLACRSASNSNPPFIQENRSPNGEATSSSLWASLPCRQGFSLPYRARISSGARSLWPRSEEASVGEECVSQGSSRWSPYD